MKSRARLSPLRCSHGRELGECIMSEGADADGLYLSRTTERYRSSVPDRSASAMTEQPSKNLDASARPPDEIASGLFATGRRTVGAHPFLTDALVSAAVLGACTLWLVQSRFASVPAGFLQGGMILTIAIRRTRPLAVFAVASGLAFVQWLLGYTLAGDVAVLVALYTVAAHERRLRALLATVVLEVGAGMAAARWHPAKSVALSFLFLSATVIAALFAGFTVASGSRYLEWMDERAERLEVERDQQAVIAAASERTRIARELHDIVSHSLSVVVTLADGAQRIVSRDPARAARAVAQVSEVGRRALSDMRVMLGVLRHDASAAPVAPAPRVSELEHLVDSVRATGLEVDFAIRGESFAAEESAELTIYRIVQEALTNTIRHASARRARVTLTYDAPTVRILVEDDGVGGAPAQESGHGIRGMEERAALHNGRLLAGPGLHGGWSVAATLRVDSVPARVSVRS